MLMKVVTEERQDGTKLFFVAGDLNVEIFFYARTTSDSEVIEDNGSRTCLIVVLDAIGCQTFVTLN